MSKKTDKLLVIFTDVLMLVIVWFSYYQIRVESGLFSYYVKPEFFVPMIAI
ncbi:hypothetical protein JGI3_00798, partial [Candidatus Kryptobacter tengchongensis]